jgi:hypothetical protein
MASRHFPVRPNLDQLRHQAKDLLRAIRFNDPNAVADFREYIQSRSIPHRSCSPTHSLSLPVVMAYLAGPIL